MGCGKAELALLFYPDSASGDAARHRLMRWIKGDPMLLDRLVRAGYRSRQHNFTPLQVSIIYEIMGEPI